MKKMSFGRGSLVAATELCLFVLPPGGGGKECLLSWRPKMHVQGMLWAATCPPAVPLP